VKVYVQTRVALSSDYQ